MSETLYMMEIEQLLEKISENCKQLDELKRWTVKTLTHHYGLNLDDAESQVAAAAGEEP